MIRVFSHFIPVRIVLLIILEVLVWMASIRFGLSFQRIGSGATGAFLEANAPLQAAAFTLGMLIVLSSMGLYHADRWRDTRDAQFMVLRLFAAVVLGFGITVVVVHFAPSLHWAPNGLAVALLLAFSGSALVRFALYRWNRLATFKSRVLVLGTGSRITKLVEFAQRNHNHVVVGYVSLQPSANHHVPLPRVLPIVPGESLMSVGRKYSVDQIVIAVRDRRGGGFPVQELLQCRLQGIKIIELSTFFEREYRQVLLESLNPSWMVFGEGFRQGLLRTTAKRLFDLVASTVLLLLTLPIMLITAICIIWENGFPVFYRQDRVGQGGRVFSIYKFRSMKNDAESDETPRWASADDERTTRVGRVIRKLRIDELPQIINVIKGEMSFVGPRPERPYFVDKLSQQIPYYSLRHSLKPGITGWAQVRYPYGASVDDAVEKLQYDLYYVKNHTLFLDLVILIATVEIVLWGGAVARTA
jgi:sugar transferase (PEP-CTERM system associated)